MVITADFWRNPNVATIVIVEIEPKKNTEKRSDSNNDLKEDLKAKLFVFSHTASFHDLFRLSSLDRYLDTHTTPHLSSSDLPPELA